MCVYVWALNFLKKLPVEDGNLSQYRWGQGGKRNFSNLATSGILRWAGNRGCGTRKSRSRRRALIAVAVEGVRVRVRVGVRPGIHHHHHVVVQLVIVVVQRDWRRLLVGHHLHHNVVVVVQSVRTVRGQDQRIVDAPRRRMEVVRVIRINLGSYAVVIVVVLLVLVLIPMATGILVHGLIGLVLRIAQSVGLVVVLDIVGHELCAIHAVVPLPGLGFGFRFGFWPRLCFRSRLLQFWQTIGEKY